MYYDLGIRLGFEDMALAEEVVAKGLIIVDLAVEDDPDRAILIGKRLVSPGQVDDRQPAKTEPDLS
jgi:hypothetical protein